MAYREISLKLYYSALLSFWKRRRHPERQAAGSFQSKPFVLGTPVTRISSRQA